MTKTYFQFNGKFYKQMSGTSMGTKCAPSYAILFMGKLEENFLRTQRFQPHIWWRYIDDIFMIWPHGPEKLDAFILGLNNYHPSIKFTVTSSPETADFLDITSKKDATVQKYTPESTVFSHHSFKKYDS